MISEILVVGKKKVASARDALSNRVQTIRLIGITGQTNSCNTELNNKRKYRSRHSGILLDLLP